ncbi:hypothetical protein F4775DRAFT_199739 [Biscogniauxia sp. FL1348]|nr:hypothetical protein F4775DRAFT_199739 [Biscogniauxia sp. FL1348]
MFSLFVMFMSLHGIMATEERKKEEKKAETASSLGLIFSSYFPCQLFVPCYCFQEKREREKEKERERGNGTESSAELSKIK